MQTLMVSAKRPEKKTQGLLFSQYQAIVSDCAFYVCQSQNVLFSYFTWLCLSSTPEFLSGLGLLHSAAFGNARTPSFGLELPRSAVTHIVVVFFKLRLFGPVTHLVVSLQSHLFGIEFAHSACM